MNGAHVTSLLFAGLAADSFALVRMPLPLYGSGPRICRISAATWPTSSLLGPLIVTMVLLATANVIPAGALYSTGWEYAYHG